MTLEPLLDASPAIQVHVLTVVPAAVLGAWLLVGPKGTPGHRLLGRIWMLLMVASAISAFFIHTIRMIGPFSPIHLLSVLVMAGAVQAVRAARRGDIGAHRRGVTGMYLGGIVGAGVFTLLPGRIMNAVVFSGTSFAALVTVLSFFAVLLAPFVVKRILSAREVRILEP